MPKERLYRVTFDTQRDRRYITWGLFIVAPNQKEAKAGAEELWYHSNKCPYRSPHKASPHMYHTNAARMNPEEQDHEPGTFFIIESRFATWGRR